MDTQGPCVPSDPGSKTRRKTFAIEWQASVYLLPIFPQSVGNSLLPRLQTKPQPMGTRQEVSPREQAGVK